MTQAHAICSPVSGAAVIPLPFPYFVWSLPAFPRLPLVQVKPLPEFARTSARRSGIALLALLAAGLIGLAWSAADLNGLYAKRSNQVKILHNQLLAARGRLAEQEKWATRQQERIRQIDTLSFQVNAFSRRYPLFARILKSVQAQSPRFGFHPALVLGIVQVESGFNPWAMSIAGACGLMQVRYAVWKNELRIDRNRLFDVEYNIELGLTILKKYFHESHGNIDKALVLYNNGYRTLNPDYSQKVSQSLYCADLPEHEMAIGVSE